MPERPFGSTGMQISRHWRMNEQRYRLIGVKYQNGEVSLQKRPILPGKVTDIKPPTPVSSSSK